MGNDPFEEVLSSAARLQQLVPDAVMVGGSAAVVHVGHRLSVDHDHVLADLAQRFEAVLDAVENDDGWATNRLVPGKVILGNLNGVDTGIRQMIRSRPLETEQLVLASGDEVTVPTADEALRIKAFLVLRRNAVRDYVDSAALADHLGVTRAGRVLADMDSYYADQRGPGEEGVASQVARQFSEPLPADPEVTKELDRYKRLEQRWTDWTTVCEVLGNVATAMVFEAGED